MAIPEMLKDRRRQLWVLIVIVLLLMNLILFLSYKPVQVLDIRRQCERGECRISFRLFNRTLKKKATYVMVRALQKVSGQGPDAPTTRMVGEAVHFYELNPREKREVTVELVLMVPLPDIISVKARPKQGIRDSPQP